MSRNLSQERLGPILVIQDSKSLADGLGSLVANAIKDSAFVGDGAGRVHWVETATL